MDFWIRFVFTTSARAHKTADKMKTAKKKTVLRARARLSYNRFKFKQPRTSNFQLTAKTDEKNSDWQIVNIFNAEKLYLALYTFK